MMVVLDLFLAAHRSHQLKGFTIHDIQVAGD